MSNKFICCSLFAGLMCLSTTIYADNFVNARKCRGKNKDFKPSQSQDIKKLMSDMNAHIDCVDLYGNIYISILEAEIHARKTGGKVTVCPPLHDFRDDFYEKIFTYTNKKSYQGLSAYDGVYKMLKDMYPCE